MKESWVYILTNEAMPEYIKIGETTNLEKRLDDLFKTGVPLPFDILCAYKFDTKNKAQTIEGDLLNLFLTKHRHNKKREFIQVLDIKKMISVNDPNITSVKKLVTTNPKTIEKNEILKRAYNIVDSAWTYLDRTKSYKKSHPRSYYPKAKKPSAAVTAPTKTNSTKNVKKNERFSFEKCGIGIGSTLYLTKDGTNKHSKIKAKVRKDEKILVFDGEIPMFRGKETSMSSAAQTLLKIKSQPQGTLHWMYRDKKYGLETLVQRRKRMENDGTYRQAKQKQKTRTGTNPNNGSSFEKAGLKIGTIIYFKYDPSLKAKVYDDKNNIQFPNRKITTAGKQITLDDEIMNISKATKIIKNWPSANGFEHWTYKGKRIKDLCDKNS